MFPQGKKIKKKKKSNLTISERKKKKKYPNRLPHKYRRMMYVSPEKKNKK